MSSGYLWEFVLGVAWMRNCGWLDGWIDRNKEVSSQVAATCYDLN